MQQKILIVLLTILTILSICAWYTNIFRVDIFATKNRYVRNQKRIKIMNEQNIDSQRKKAVKILDNYETHRSDSDKDGCIKLKPANGHSMSIILDAYLVVVV